MISTAAQIEMKSAGEAGRQGFWGFHVIFSFILNPIKERIWEIPRNSDSQTVSSFRQEAKDLKGQGIRIPGAGVGGSGESFLTYRLLGPTTDYPIQ